MHYIKPNYTSFEFADVMSSNLRNLVEQFLLTDLKHYGVDVPDLKFDWSDSCIEGHNTNYLNSSLENYSGIYVFNRQDDLVAEGWMEFIHISDFFITYWDYISIYNKKEILKEKTKSGIPDHIWIQIPDNMKSIFKDDRFISKK